MKDNIYNKFYYNGKDIIDILREHNMSWDFTCRSDTNETIESWVNPDWLDDIVFALKEFSRHDEDNKHLTDEELKLIMNEFFIERHKHILDAWKKMLDILLEDNSDNEELIEYKGPVKTIKKYI